MENPYGAYAIPLKKGSKVIDTLTGIISKNHVDEYLAIHNTIVVRNFDIKYGLRTLVGFPLLNGN